jgi:hypothetical protein
MRTRLRLLLATFLLSLTASAATFTPVAGDLTLTVLSQTSDLTILGFDVRGVVGIGVTQDAFTDDFILGDGTNIGFPDPAVPNTLLIVSNAPAVTEGFIAQLSNPRLGGPGFLLDSGFSAPISATLTEPIMQYLAANTLLLGFELVDSSQITDEQTLSVWTLAGVAGPDISTQVVPEPSSALLLLGGGIGFAFWRRFARS